MVVNKSTRRVALGGLTLGGIMFGIASLLVLRQRYAHRGASGAEKRYPLVAPGYVQHSVRALDIRATPADVFAWLKQLGQDKGGFYSYAALENLLGLGIQNTDRIHPEWQSLKKGDAVQFAARPEVKAAVTALNENRHLQLQFGSENMHFSWDFHLFSTADGYGPKTRLVVATGLKGSSRTHAFWRWLGDLPHGIMEWGLLRGVQKRAELYPTER